jgi:hypothetical protein
VRARSRFLLYHRLTRSVFLSNCDRDDDEDETGVSSQRRRRAVSGLTYIANEQSGDGAFRAAPPEALAGRK